MDTLLTVAETAQKLRVSQSMVRKLLKSGQLAHLPIGTRKLVPEKRIAEFINSNLRTHRGEGRL